MYPGKRVSKLKKINNLKKMIENQHPQSAKLSYRRVVTPFFDDHHSTRVFPQKAPSSLARIQEP
jgi:hypothetical protein